jgi:hypothetical protein
MAKIGGFDKFIIQLIGKILIYLFKLKEAEGFI